MVEMKFNDDIQLPIALQVIVQMEQNCALFCLLPCCDRNLEEMGYQYTRFSAEEESKNNSQVRKRNSGDRENQTGLFEKISNFINII